MFLYLLPVRSILANTVSYIVREFLQIGYKSPPWLKDGLITVCWSKVRGEGHCDLTKHISVHNSRICEVIVFITNYIQLCLEDKILDVLVYRGGCTLRSEYGHVTAKTMNDQ